MKLNSLQNPSDEDPARALCGTLTRAALSACAREKQSPTSQRTGLRMLTAWIRMLCVAWLVAGCTRLPGLKSEGDTGVSLQSLLGEMAERDALARWPRADYVCRQASSYDRAQTDPNDRKTWFANKDHSQFLRVETTPRGKEWVVMEDRSPGCVTRIWTACEPKLYGQIIRFYLDDNPVPAIEAPFVALVSGKGFVGEPFAIISSDEKDAPQMEGLPPGHPPQVGMDFFLPVPYARSCKITFSGEPLYYHINYRSYAAGTAVEPFSMARFAAASKELARTGKALLASGNVGAGRPVRRGARLEPGQELALDTPVGPGAVRSLTLRLPATLAKDDLRALDLQMRFDGEATVCCPVSEFFGGGVGVRPVQVRNWVSAVASNGVFSCWWVMPFRSAGRVALVNRGTKAVAADLELTVGAWTWDEHSLLFHANWRMSSPIKPPLQQDWNYITIAGRGVYVGDTLSVLNPLRFWYGEGDERIYIDGEAFPSHLGTGTEDYYGFAWGMAHEFSSPFVSMPRRDKRGKQDWSGHTTTTRVRVLDAIPFRSALRFDMEAWHAPNLTPMEYAAATFWYARPGATHNREMR